MCIITVTSGALTLAMNEGHNFPLLGSFCHQHIMSEGLLSLTVERTVMFVLFLEHMKCIKPFE